MSFREAVENFPIIAWSQENLRNVKLGVTEITADCPFCEGRQKLYLNIEKKITNCFRCEAHGVRKGGANLLQFIGLLVGSRKEAYRLILDLSGTPDIVREIPTYEFKSVIPDGAIALSELPDHEPASELLTRRHAKQLIPFSYVCVTGDYAGRVILPCYYDGRLTGTECKSIYKAIKPKSLFHPPHKFKASETVYTTLKWDHTSSVAVITESILDAETFSGIANGLGVYGSNLNSKQVDAILALGIDTLYWAFDGDALLKVIKLIPKRTLDLFDNRVIKLDQKDDPNSIGPVGCQTAFANAVKIQTEWDLYDLIEWGKW